MANLKITLNKNGVGELLRSEEVAEICREHAEATCRNAGEGFVVEPRNYPERHGYAVRVDSAEAYKKNLKSNILLKSLS